MSVANSWIAGEPGAIAAAFRQQHGDRVGFLAGRTAGNPDPDVIVFALALEQLRDDQLFELLERRRDRERNS